MSWRCLSINVLGLLASLCLAWARPARAQAVPPAQPQPVRKARLSYLRQPGAEGCPDEDSLRRAVSSRLGRDGFADDAELVVQAAVDRAAQGLGLVARLALSDGQGRVLGKREIASPASDCLELSAAVVLAISVAIDPVAAMRVVPLPPAAPVPALTPVASPPPPTAQVELAVEAPAPSSRPVELGLSAWLSAWDAPALSPGLAVEARYRWPAASLALEGAVSLPVSSPASIGHVVSWRLVASAVPCLHLGAFFGCARASVGALTLSGDGLDDARTVSTVYGALGLRAGAQLVLHPSFGLRAYLEALAPLARIGVLVGNERTWSTPPVAAAAGLGGFFRF